MMASPNGRTEVVVWVMFAMLLLGASLMIGCSPKSNPLALQESGDYSSKSSRPVPSESVDCPPLRQRMTWNTKPQGGPYEKSNSAPATVAGRFPAA